jgi:pyruvate/2-oxoglutarate dehydrogenase complex dihydrolipoamide dehydrogenase (E3) component
MYIHSQINAIKKAGIELRLNTEVTPALAEAIGADVIIASLGAKPVKPSIPGIDGKHVMRSEYAYTNPGQVGETAVILGAGLVGLELAIYLAMLGKKVTVIEMADKINDGGNMLHAESLQLELKKNKIAVDLNTAASEITDSGIICVTDGMSKLYAADTVIYAVGQKPLQTEALSLKFCAPEFYMLGDCVAPRNIYRATSMAYDIARNIGRY